MTNIRSEQFAVWNPSVNLRQVKRADTGEIVTGPDAAQVGRTVDGSPTEVEGEVLVGGAMWLNTGEFLVEETFDKCALIVLGALLNVLSERRILLSLLPFRQTAPKAGWCMATGRTSRRSASTLRCRTRWS